MAITQPTAASGADQPASYRILVVDDNENCAKVLMWTLEILGHVAITAHDGQSAMALAKSFDPEVVLLDIGIPEMNGYEICQAMRGEPGLGKALFIAQTGWGGREHHEMSRQAGFDHHLVKPVNIDALKAILLAWKPQPE